ncbi:MAG: retroviral-like aspartic protease family protein [Muribaculaceae bacterium]|nr:retroviral-like aspartic protease family protein [Muribaculaceae bacterium]MDE6754041.1 retroviral-like aspartic protease family protein [Muribaculaceae bacterium]
MYRYLFFIIAALSLSLQCLSKSPEKQITDAMIASDWFALDSLYKAIPENELSDFIDVFSRCLIGNRLNRPQVSIPAFEQLLSVHSEEISNISTYAMMYAIDLSRLGQNSKAASVLSDVLNSNRQNLDSSEIKKLERVIKRYEWLAKYKPYSIFLNDDTGIIPFNLVPAGNPENKGMLMRLQESDINGIGADIIFDTGAAMNIISDSLAEKYNLSPLDVEVKVSGFRSSSGSFALAKELKIGNITLNDVPFLIMNITSHNAEADRYIKDLQLFVGSELMLQLKDLTIDFENNQIIVPAEAQQKTDTAPNLCFSSSMNLLAKGSIRTTPLLMNIDTGDASFGTVGKTFYKKNKKLIKTTGHPTELRRGGIGGAEITKGYTLPDIELSLGGSNTTLPYIEVNPDTDPFGYECNLGLNSLRRFRKVRFNLVDFVLSATE